MSSVVDDDEPADGGEHAAAAPAATPKRKRAQQKQGGVSEYVAYLREKHAKDAEMEEKRFKGTRNNKTFLQRLRCILWVITLHSTISYYKMRFYTRKTELEASTCQFPRKLRS